MHSADAACGCAFLGALVAAALAVAYAPSSTAGSPLQHQPELRETYLVRPRAYTRGEEVPMTHPVLIPANTERDLARPGPWWWGFNAPAGEPPSAPLLRCPHGHTARLTCHDVAADGRVSPSIVCPEDGCTWHVWGRLEGWSSGPRRADPR